MNSLSKHWFGVSGCIAIGLLLVCVSSARAQESTPKYEVGVHYSALNVSEKSDTDSGVGVRFTYNLNKYLGLEAETTDFPNMREGSLGNERQGLFGVRVGKRNKHFGLFAKARPGVTNFDWLVNSPGPNIFEQGHTRFTFDAGGVFEYYPVRHAAVRVDVGDTMVHYKTEDFFFRGFQPVPIQNKLSHNLQINIGFALRF